MAELIARQSVQVRRTVVTLGPFALATLTDRVVVTLERPTSTRSLSWGADDVLDVTLLIETPGEPLRCVGRTRGGVKTSLITGLEHDTYQLAYRLPWGFFDTREGFPKRLGELGQCQCSVLLTLREGNGAETSIRAVSEEREAPRVAFHSSVAFQNATDAQEISGDGTLSLSHTASGSNLAAFAGMGFDHGGGTSTSMTYNGVAMTELWDFDFATFYGQAGYSLAAPASGTQTVTNIVTNIGDNHALGVITMTGVHQTVPVGTDVTTSAASATTISVDVTDATTDNLVVDNFYLSGQQGAWTAGAGQNEVNSETLSTSEFFRQSWQLGSAAGVMSWSTAGDAAPRISLGAVAFKPSVDVAAGPSSRLSLLGVS